MYNNCNDPCAVNNCSNGFGQDYIWIILIVIVVLFGFGGFGGYNNQGGKCGCNSCC